MTGAASARIADGYCGAFDKRFEARLPAPIRRAFTAVKPDEAAASLARSRLSREIEASRPLEGVELDLGRLADEYRLGVLTNGILA